MSQINNPEEIAITPQNFSECGWRSIIENVESVNNLSLWRAYSRAARQAQESHHSAHSKILWLLADLCSMVLTPSSVNQPFTYATALNGSRSAIPDDFSDTDVDFFVNIINDVDHVWLKTRIADFIWSKQRRRGISYALTAIDGYRSMPLTQEAWREGAGLGWERAIRLARQLRTGAGDRLTEIVDEIHNSLLESTIDDGFHCLHLSKLMEAADVEHNRSEEIAQKLETLATALSSRNSFDALRKYSIAASEWFERINNHAKVAEMTAQVAEGWAREAETRANDTSPSHRNAASFYEKAIQVYRSIPRVYRDAHSVDDRMPELRNHLNEQSELALLEMSSVSSTSIDLSDSITYAQQAVSGKEISEALLSFSNLHSGADVEQLHTDAMELLNQAPFLALISSTMVSRDGRTIARQPGMDSENNDDRIHAEMVKCYEMQIRLIVQGRILPALDILLLEHVMQESDFIDLARQSLIIPAERATLFGKALYAGYDRDFITALHILVPQIEHMVRTHLKQSAAITTTLDPNGIENENGLGSLLDLPRSEEIFGSNLRFELKSLFCDPVGPNLRNELAHGLIDENDCHSHGAIYAWWLSLRLVFNTWWNTRRIAEDALPLDSHEESN